MTTTNRIAEIKARFYHHDGIAYLTNGERPNNGSHGPNWAEAEDDLKWLLDRVALLDKVAEAASAVTCIHGKCACSLCNALAALDSKDGDG